MTQTLSKKEAAKLALLSQGIHKNAQLGSGKNAALKAIEKLGYIQIDTISVIERAHHHTLWNRANNYQVRHLNQLLVSKDVFEYWSHAAAYLPMRDYRYSLPRKQAIKGGERHWYEPNPKLEKWVLDQVKEKGPMQARDFDNDIPKIKGGWGETKAAKRGLEQLFMQGDLMICDRQGFQKVFDLPERVLPSSVDTTTPSKKEFLNHLILCTLHAHGIAQPSEIAHLRKGIKRDVTARCEAMLKHGEIEAVKVGEQTYFATKDYQTRLNQPLSQSKVKILSPFDNLVIQRKRCKALFDFDYTIECYVPATKRVHGYFVLPILWGQRIAGRMDCKVDRKKGVLTIHKLFIETDKYRQFILSLTPALEQFLQFNNAAECALGQIIVNNEYVSKRAIDEVRSVLTSVCAE